MRLRHLAFCVLCLACVGVAGCGESTEVLFQKAQISSKRGELDQALYMVDLVLAEKPEDLEALLLKGNVQRRMGRWFDSKATLDQLLATHGDHYEVRREMLAWSWQRLGNLLKQSEVIDGGEGMTPFQETINIVLAQATWFDQRDDGRAEASLTRARAAQYELALIQRRFAAHRASLRGVDADYRQLDRADKRKTEELLAEIDQTREQIQGYLEQALDADPKHLDALERYAKVLTDRGQWADIWRLAEDVAGSRKDLTPEAGWEIVTGLLKTPDLIHPEQERIDLGWQVQVSVAEDQRDQLKWLLNSVRLHHKAEQWIQAKPLLDAASKNHPRDLIVKFQVAQNHFGQKQFHEALAVLKPLFEKTTAPDTHVLYAWALAKVGERMMAGNILRGVLERDPEHAGARQTLLAVLAEDGYLAEAARDAEKHVVQNPGDADALRLGMQFALARGDREGVERLLKQAESVKKKGVDLLSFLIDGYLNLEQFEKALLHAEEIAELRPDLIEAQLYLAEVHVMQGEYDKAALRVANVRTRFELHTPSEHILGGLYLRRGLLNRAIGSLRSALTVRPSNLTRMLLAKALAASSRPGEAIEQINKVLESEPQRIDAHALASRLYLLTGMRQKSEEHLDRVDAAQVDEIKHSVLLARIKVKEGKLDEALFHCNRAIVSGNTDPMLRFVLADIYARKGDDQRQEMHLLALARLWPRFPFVYTALQRYYIEHGTVRRGIETLGELSKLDPVLPALTQAAMLVEIEQQEQALRHLGAAYDSLILAKNPEALRVAGAMANIYRQLGQPARAASIYDRMIQFDFLESRARYQQLLVRTAGQKPAEQVRAILDFADRLSANETSLRGAVVDRLTALGATSESLALLDQWTVDEDANLFLLLRKGDILSRNSRGEDAVRVFRRAVARNPAAPHLRRRLAGAYLVSLNFPAAEREYLESIRLDEQQAPAALSSLGRMYYALGLYKLAAATFDELEAKAPPRDPLLLYAMAQADLILDRRESARLRLSRVPLLAPSYAHAQIMLASLDAGDGNLDRSTQRIQALLKHPRTAPTAVRQLLSMDVHDPKMLRLLESANQAFDLSRAPESVQVRWLGLRWVLAAEKRDWISLLQTQERLDELKPQVATVIGARVVVLLHTGKRQEARELYLRAAKVLSSSRMGPLLATLINAQGSGGGQLTDGYPGDTAGGVVDLARYCQALMKGDPSLARSIASNMSSAATLFKSDLLDLTAREDVRSKPVIEHVRSCALAIAAVDLQMPQLAAEICERLIKEEPALTLAPSVHSHARRAHKQDMKPMIAEWLPRVQDKSIGYYLAAEKAKLAGDHAEQAAQLTKLLAREPRNDLVRVQLGRALFAAGSVSEALAQFRRLADDDNPYRAEAANVLAFHLAKNDPDKLDEAHALAIAALKQQPGHGGYMDTLGWIQHLRGRELEALALLRKAVVTLPKHPTVHYHLGVVYDRLADQRWARLHLQVAADIADADAPEAAQARQLLAELKAD